MWKPDIVQAGVYEDAYSYYQSYENDMRFLSGTNNEGEIYYATKGKLNLTAGIRYKTIGWKVRVFDREGALVDTIYYKLGGNHMTQISVRIVDGYEYGLYKVTLENLKSRLSPAGLETLNSSDCNIVFDACICVRKNGVLQGEMTDAGPSKGEVYTTYNGIVNAAPWSEATRESLKSYYNKNVEGLFYKVEITDRIGIRQVSGAGTYCFGTTVTIQAECEDGYHFLNWTGSATSESQKYSFVLYGNNMSFTANAEENSYIVQFDSAGGNGSIPEQMLTYCERVILPKDGIRKANASLSGWKIKEEVYSHGYKPTEQLNLSDLVKKLGLERTDGAKIVFHASWDEGPLIQTEEIYVSLADAAAGKISESWLAKKASAHDLEDGEIPYGKHQNTSFFMENYRESDFTKFQEEGSIEKTFTAVDSAGNTTKKDILIHIVNTETYPEDKILGRVRFISEKYFWDKNKKLVSEELGGLADDSIWRWDDSYRVLLEKLFQLKGEN